MYALFGQQPLFPGLSSTDSTEELLKSLPSKTTNIRLGRILRDILTSMHLQVQNGQNEGVMEKNEDNQCTM